MAWALDQSGMRPTDKLVLIGIANHASKDGDNAYPKIATLAKYAGVSERAVQKCLAQLEADGRIVRVVGRGGSRRVAANRRPNAFCVVMRGLNDATVAAARDELQDTPRGEPQGTARGVLEGTARGELQDVPHIRNRPVEPSLRTTPKPPQAADGGGGVASLPQKSGSSGEAWTLVAGWRALVWPDDTDPRQTELPHAESVLGLVPAEREARHAFLAEVAKRCSKGTKVAHFAGAVRHFKAVAEARTKQQGKARAKAVEQDRAAEDAKRKDSEAAARKDAKAKFDAMPEAEQNRLLDIEKRKRPDLDSVVRRGGPGASTAAETLKDFAALGRFGGSP